jgi:hypothetical protein
VINFSSRLIYESTRKASFSRIDDYEAVTESGLTVGCMAVLAVAAGSRCFPVGGVARGRRILRGFYASARRFRSEIPREVVRSSDAKNASHSLPVNNRAVNG